MVSKKSRTEVRVKIITECVIILLVQHSVLV